MTNSCTAAQLGARMHYAVPRIMAAAGRLERFYTDFSASKGWPRLLQLWPAVVRPPVITRLLGRSPAGIPANRIFAFNQFGQEYGRRRRTARGREQALAVYLWAGREFCRKVLNSGLGDATAVYTFNSAGLELLQAARETQRHAVVEQTIAPLAVENHLIRMETERFPGWEPAPEVGSHASEFSRREAEEWDTADQIVCGSDFVRDAIMSCGGPASKCVVVPYGVDPMVCGVSPMKRVARSGKRPLRVLTVGAVGLRKGSAYVLEAARLLKGCAEFRMVGSIGVNPEAQGQLREALDLRGPVPRSEVSTHFEWADLFLLPSVCEGSATVTYEALAHGLPVICTPNTGSVVRHEIDGFIVPAGDAIAIAGCIETLERDRTRLEQMSRNALERAQDFTLEAYGRRLLAALTPLPASAGAAR